MVCFREVGMVWYGVVWCGVIGGVWCWFSIVASNL